MKVFKKIITVFFLLFFIPLRGETPPEDEIAVVDRLIEQTKMQLELQHTLRRSILEFKTARDRFVEQDQSKTHAREMVSSAHTLWNLITKHHMQYLFSPEYLDELYVFASIAAKNSLKRP